MEFYSVPDLFYLFPLLSPFLSLLSSPSFPLPLPLLSSLLSSLFSLLSSFLLTIYAQAVFVNAVGVTIGVTPIAVYSLHRSLVR